MKNPITIKISISEGIDKVWEYWTNPDHIVNWNFATDKWSCPKAENDLKANGRFSWRMEAKDGSMGFDFSGTYIRIAKNELIEKELDDNRKVRIRFVENDGNTEVIETFEPDENNPEFQRQGWQAILDNFKKYVETD